jgi:hypothetical protein
MMIATQRLHCTSPIPAKRGCKLSAGVRIPRAAEVNERNMAEKPRRKSIFSLAGHQQHHAGALVRGHRKQEPAAQLECVKP